MSNWFVSDSVCGRFTSKYIILGMPEHWIWSILCGSFSTKNTHKLLKIISKMSVGDIFLIYKSPSSNWVHCTWTSQGGCHFWLFLVRSPICRGKHMNLVTKLRFVTVSSFFNIGRILRSDTNSTWSHIATAIFFIFFEKFELRGK